MGNWIFLMSEQVSGGEGGGEGGDGGGGGKIRKTRERQYEHNSFLIKNFILGDIFFSL